MSTQKKKIAVVGLGNIGKVVATNLVKGNREVIVAGRNLEDAKGVARELGSLARAAEVLAAIQEADIIILAVWFSTIKEMLSQYAAELQNKIVIDPSNPIAPDGKGGFSKIIGADESAGVILRDQLPKGAKLVKAFGTLGAASLANAAFSKPRAVLFYATDEVMIRPAIEEVIMDSGFDAHYIGGVDKSIRIEVFGDLHEFGALGKTVTLAELQNLKP